jgi:hypothetical protein
MSGGELHIGTPTSLANEGGLKIESDISKISVTGGDIHAYLPTAGNYFGVSTTAPLYNLNIWKESAASDRVMTLNTDLVIKNDLILADINNPSLYCANYDLTLGRNLIDSAGQIFIQVLSVQQTEPIAL